MGPFKGCHLHNSIFHPIQLSRFVNFILWIPLLYSLNLTKKLYNDRKEDFLHLRLLQCITFYQRRQKITSFDIIEFFDTHVCINNPYWEISGIMILLFKYSSDISHALVGSFMNVLFFVAGFNIIRASWETKT